MPDLGKQALLLVAEFFVIIFVSFVFVWLGF